MNVRSWSQATALVFLVAPDDVAPTARSRDVLLALEVAVDAVAGDELEASVAERLHVASDSIAPNHRGPALVELDAATDLRAADEHVPVALGLDVADDPDRGRSQPASPAPDVAATRNTTSSDSRRMTRPNLAVGAAATMNAR
jgi:hypothetical protein